MVISNKDAGHKSAIFLRVFHVRPNPGELAVSEFDYFIGALGASVVRVIPAVVVVLITAAFARELRTFVIAGMLPTLIIPAVALLAWLQLGRPMLSFQDDPTQQVYDIVVSLALGGLVGYIAYTIKRGRKSSP